jgi:putative transcriptional regulator
MDSLRGHLLIAPPHLVDPNFARSVVLLIQHDREGAFGVILNRPTDRTIRDVWKEVRGAECECRQGVHLGGPVTGPLVALHAEPALGEIQVMDGVFCSMAADKIEELVGADRSLVRFYAGYAGWGKGQLEGEMQAGSWLTTPALAENVFGTPPAALWRTVLRRASDVHPDVHDLDPGDDPRLN